MCRPVFSQDDEVIEHLNQLRESLFSAFTGILDGLQGDKEHMLFGEYVEKIIPFIQLTASDQDREEDVVRAAVGFIGFVSSSFCFVSFTPCVCFWCLIKPYTFHNSS